MDFLTEFVDAGYLPLEVKDAWTGVVFNKENKVLSLGYAVKGQAVDCSYDETACNWQDTIDQGVSRQRSCIISNIVEDQQEPLTYIGEDKDKAEQVLKTGRLVEDPTQDDATIHTRVMRRYGLATAPPMGLQALFNTLTRGQGQFQQNRDHFTPFRGGRGPHFGGNLGVKSDDLRYKILFYTQRVSMALVQGTIYQGHPLISL